MRPVALICSAALSALVLSGCSGATPDLATAPGCSSTERLGLVAQSVPSSSYVPCVTRLATGWHSDRLVIRTGSTTFELASDRAPNSPVRVSFGARCSTSAAAPVPPRTLGGRTYLGLRTIDPMFTGTLYDAFPGGCVTYRFAFRRGPHIALMAELQSSIGFVARDRLDRSLRRRLGVEVR